MMATRKQPTADDRLRNTSEYLSGVDVGPRLKSHHAELRQFHDSFETNAEWVAQFVAWGTDAWEYLVREIAPFTPDPNKFWLAYGYDNEAPRHAVLLASPAFVLGFAEGALATPRKRAKKKLAKKK